MWAKLWCSKEFLRRNLLPGSAGEYRLAYMDLPRLALTPEGFAVQYVGYLLYWMLGDFRQRFDEDHVPAW